MAPRNPQDPGDRRNPWTRPGFLAAASLLGALVVLAVILVATSGGGTTHTTQTQAGNPTTSETSATTTRSSGNPNACTLPAGGQSIPSASPPLGTSWAQVGSMSTPQAPSRLGPQRSADGYAICFAHSASGALLAAFNFLAQSTAHPSGQVYRHLAVNVPSQAYNTSSRLDNEGPLQFAAYKYESYTGSTANLIVVIQSNQGGLEAVGLVMEWTGTDWRYDFPPNGVPPIQRLSDLTRYVAWNAFRCTATGPGSS
jgi:hypothetical protein